MQKEETKGNKLVEFDDAANSEQLCIIIVSNISYAIAGVKLLSKITTTTTKHNLRNDI